MSDAKTPAQGRCTVKLIDCSPDKKVLQWLCPSARYTQADRSSGPCVTWLTALAFSMAACGGGGEEPSVAPVAESHDSASSARPEGWVSGVADVNAGLGEVSSLGASVRRRALASAPPVHDEACSGVSPSWQLGAPLPGSDVSGETALWPVFGAVSLGEMDPAWPVGDGEASGATSGQFLGALTRSRFVLKQIKLTGVEYWIGGFGPWTWSAQEIWVDDKPLPSVKEVSILQRIGGNKESNRAKPTEAEPNLTGRLQYTEILRGGVIDFQLSEMNPFFHCGASGLIKRTGEISLLLSAKSVELGNLAPEVLDPFSGNMLWRNVFDRQGSRTLCRKWPVDKMACTTERPWHPGMAPGWPNAQDITQDKIQGQGFMKVASHTTEVEWRITHPAGREGICRFKWTLTVQGSTFRVEKPWHPCKADEKYTVQLPTII